MHIRWMVRRDMPEVMAIEGQGDDPWTEDDLLSFLRRRDVVGMVAEDAEKRVAGFMLYELHKDRLRILKLAVARQRRRQRIGSKMVAKLVSKLSAQRRSRMEIEVPETNMGALRFFQFHRFLAEKVIRGEDEDRYLMAFCVNQEAPVQG